MFIAALIYLGKDPNSAAPADLEAASALLKDVRPLYPLLSTPRNTSTTLPNGDLCVAHGYSGDILQARDRAGEAGNGVEVALGHSARRRRPVR